MNVYSPEEIRRGSKDGRAYYTTKVVSEMLRRINNVRASLHCPASVGAEQCQADILLPCRKHQLTEGGKATRSSLKHLVFRVVFMMLNHRDCRLL